MSQQISNDEWFEANLNPAAYRANLGIRIPDLPPDDVQLGFTARKGRQNLQQAFDFYKFVLGNLPELVTGEYNVLDFGGGWGRILRFFLREFPAPRLIMVDCMTKAVESARGLSPPFRIIHSQVTPPLPLRDNSIGLCYAFSVFSHLAEEHCCEWLRYLAELLVSRGVLIVTTRGRAQIDHLASLIKSDEGNPALQWLPHPDTIRERFVSGCFQFYPIISGQELTPDFFGETWIPEGWMMERYAAFGFRTCHYYSEFETVDQCVFVLGK